MGEYVIKIETSSLGSSGQPISISRFSKLMETIGPFEASPNIAVGVSGGPDSLALAILLNRWVKARNGKAFALTVDHGLRPESTLEARQVREWLKSLAMSHRILCWNDSPKNGVRIQEAARLARLRLMGDWCRDNDIIHLLMAHHQEDQSDTFLKRLASGSGVDGLAAMPKSRVLSSNEGKGVRLLRPLLNTTANDLSATLESVSQPWISDPSNYDLRFSRVRLNASRKILEKEGLSPKRLTQLSARAGRDRATLDILVSHFLADNTVFSSLGYILLAGYPWKGIYESVLIRAFSRLISTFSGASKPPRLRKVEELVTRIGSQKVFSSITLGGCRFVWKNKQESILVTRESGRIKDFLKITPGEVVYWDGRFLVGLEDSSNEEGIVRRLTQQDVANVRRLSQNTDNYRYFENIPASAKFGLPIIEGLDGSIIIPHLKNITYKTRSWAIFAPSIPLCEKAFDRVENN
ncbi:MAG: tRNA lysidine(34) synthetase TilS [Rhodospirillaceae bacterium]|nr:tRNA lysidine(34) synthetase TilS [Rhodospirillaceae bacterium]|tara:strand:- start:6572 stop:7969 length:1398 start_codon:yes stop_codon:yes gene_type:complete